MEGRASAEVHLLPARIDYRGAALVTAYWGDAVWPEGFAQFRGRRLVREVVDVPMAWEGSLLTPSPPLLQPPPAGDCGLRRLLARSAAGGGVAVTSIQAWEREALPAEGSALRHTLEWLPLAKALHAAVPPPQ